MGESSERLVAYAHSCTEMYRTDSLLPTRSKYFKGYTRHPAPNSTPEGQAYNKIELRHRIMVGLVYFGLIAVLALPMAATFVPDPAGQSVVA